MNHARVSALLRGTVWLGMLVGGVAPAWAATHQVSVIDFAFNPSELTIKVGDTVRWTNTAPGPAHDVVADDQRFRSEQSASFVFEHTFNSVEEVRYYCSLHSAPGLDPLTNMNGIIRVQADEPSFAINPGISDAWYFPGTAGQGFFIVVWEDIGTMFLSWFTFDTTLPPADAVARLGDAGHRWLTAQGPYSGDTATLKVYETSGGVFDSAAPAPGPSREVGTIDITWSGCNAGLLEYALPAYGLDGSIPIERIVLDNVALCETLAAP